MKNNLLRQIAAVLAILVALAPLAPLEAAKQNERKKHRNHRSKKLFGRQRYTKEGGAICSRAPFGIAAGDAW
jgi:hypothetical protein